MLTRNDFNSEQAYYLGLFKTCVPDRPEYQDKLRYAVQIMIDNAVLYKSVQDMTGVPWVFTGLLHLMECSGQEQCQIINGEPYEHKTSMHPEGVGPFDSWEQSTLFAFDRRNIADVNNWHVSEILHQLERWNGLGYANKGLNSPYLWGMSRHDPGGKYTHDGHFDPKAQTKQVGAALILKHLYTNKIWQPQTNAMPVIFDKDGSRQSHHVQLLQDSLNRLESTQPKLLTDGWAGPKTSEANLLATGYFLSGDPRIKK